MFNNSIVWGEGGEGEHLDSPYIDYDNRSSDEGETNAVTAE